MKPNISGGTTLTQTIPGRWWGFFTFLILSLLIALFCFALAPSAADAVTHKLTNPGTGGGTVRWGISGQPWLAGQHLGPGETIDITIGMMDYIYFDASTVPTTPQVGPDAGSTFTYPTSWGGDGSKYENGAQKYWYLPASSTPKTVTATFTNNDPTISNIGDQTIDEDNSTATLNFTVGDTETAEADLIVTASSDNTTLVPNNSANLTLGGTGANRTLVVTPAADENGSATITVTVEDEGGLTASDTFVLTVNPVNDPPNAVPDLATIDEDSADNIIDVLFNDTDPEDDILTLTDVADPPHGTATINFGVAYYTPDPNYYGSDSFEYTVDDGNGGTNNGTVNVTVNNINDAPTDIALSSNTVDENTAPGTAVGTFSTTDLDPTDSHTYTLVAGTGSDDNGSFNIVSNELQTAAEFDYEAKSSYSILVESDDGNGGTFEKQFTITVNDVNDAPVVDGQSFSVDENSANGTVVGTVAASDEDEPAQTLSFAVTGGTGQSVFSVNASSGEITVADSSQLDYETTSSFTLNVEVTDNGTGPLSDTAVITVNLNDVNDAPTDITLSNDNINENSAVGSMVGTFSSADQDAGDTHSYSLVAGTGSDDNGSFNIVSNELQTAAEFDYEAKNSYNIRVESNDGNGGAFQKQFTITVNNVNEAPVADDATVAIDENSANGTSVHTVVAADQDAGANGTLSYAITAGNTGNAFAINGTSGEITVNESTPLDFETTPTFNLEITVTDGGTPGLSDTAAITVNLNDVNDAPTDISLTNDNVDENSAVDTVVGVLSATDQDAGDTHVYSIQTAGVPFKIANGNELQVNGALDHETTPSYTITIRTTDQGGAGLSYDEDFTITINDVNEAPTDITLSNDNVDENSPKDAVVGVLSSTDQDAGDTHTYSIETAGMPFKIANGNELQVKDAILDFETQDSYTMTIRTKDSGGETYDKDFTITINDTNDAPTDIGLSNDNVDENSPVNTVVGLLTTTDVDVGDTHVYTIETAGVPFKIANGNELQVNGALDHETEDKYDITIRTTDSGGLFYEEAFTITIKDVNDAPIDISLSKSDVDENKSVGDDVGALSTTDQDGGDSHIYSIQTAGVPFQINGEKLEVGGPLDFETTPSYDITIRTTDSGGLFYDEVFTITINDTNDAPTDIALSNDNVDENSAVDTVVGNLSTADVDAGDTHTYSIETAGMPFKIANGNELQVKDAILDFETQDSYTMTIRTKDSGGETYDKDFTITINDTNDAPTDIALSNDNVDENSAVGTVVGDLSTTDVDVGDTHTYTIITGGVPFQINGNKLEVGGALDFETTPSYSVTIRSTDQGGTGLSYDEDFTITINDVNDAPSDIVLSKDNINENRPVATMVATFSTTDDDIGDSHSYSLVAGMGSDDNGSFSITSNKLNTAAVFDYETKSSYSIRVETNDGNGGTFQKQFTITVNDVNEAPVADDATVAIDENSANGTSVHTVVAADQDADANGTLSYAITAGNTGDAFAINPSTGEITVNDSSPLDFETTSTFSLEVTVTDGGTPALIDTAAITINLNDVNEAPVANDDTGAIDEDTILSVGAATGLLSNDSDVDAGDSFSVSSHDAASLNGAIVSVNPDGSYDYDPTGSLALQALAGGATVEDTFGYEITDSQGATDTATVTITVTGVNDAPLALDDVVGVDENATTANLVDVLLTNDSDAENDPRSITAVDTAGTLGTVTFDGGSQTLTYAADDASFEALAVGGSTTDSFDYEVADGNGGTDTATVTITVYGINDAPVAVDDAGSTDEDTVLNVAAPGLLSNDSDVDTGDSFPVTSFDAASTQGASVVVYADGSYDYDPTLNAALQTLAVGESVTDTFTYTITDSQSATDTATVTLTLNGVNDAPTDIDLDKADVDENLPAGTVVGDFSTTDVDTSDSHTYALVAGAGDADNGSFSISGTALQTSEAFDYEAKTSYSIRVQTSDGNGGTFEEQFTIAVNDIKFTLTIQKAGTAADGNCTVDASPGSPSGLGGGSGFPANYTYEDGDVVTLTATDTDPGAGSLFEEWSGDISSSNETVDITMDADKTVTANFKGTYSLTPIAGANGTISPATAVIVEHGGTQTFTMTANAPDYTIVQDILVGPPSISVAGDASPPVPALDTASYTFTNVTANHTIGAVFTDFGFNCETAATVGFPPDESATPAEISPAGEWDYFRLDLPEDGVLKVYTSGSTDTFGYLLDGSCDTGAAIASNDDRDQINNNFYIERRDMTAGTYYVAVRHWERDPGNPTGTGPYTFFAEFDTDDHPSEPDDSNLLTCNSAVPVDGELETGGNVDYFAISLTGDGTIRVYSTGTTDTVGKLYDSNEILLTTDNNSGSGNNFRIERDVSAGIYYVAVSHSDPVNGTGEYGIQLECELTHTITGTAGFGGTISPEGTVLVHEGEDQTFTITPNGTNTVYDVEVDGASVGALSSYTFTNVAANHTIVAYFQLPPGICVDISEVPLDARFQAAPANVMFVLDDSGSMDWTFLTPDTEGCFYVGGSRHRYVFDDPGDNLYGNVLARGTDRMHWKSQWFGYNRIYYNPDVEYEPWPTLSDAHPDFPRSHPTHSSPTFNLSGNYDTIDTGMADLTVTVDDEDPAPSFQKTPDVGSVIVDDRDSGFSRQDWNGGDWEVDYNDQAYNDRSYTTSDPGNYRATWTANLEATQYKVYARWEAYSSRSTTVPYTIYHAGGSDTVTVNQRSNGAKWVYLGTYTFNAGANSVVMENYANWSSRMSADAIKFEPLGGAWEWATDGDAYNSHYWWTPTNGDYTATWTPDLPDLGAPAVWEVFARWHASGERDENVTYTVNHAGGSTDVSVNQRENGGEWVSLGSYTFNAGTGGNVVLSHTRTGAVHTACADAVRFVPPVPQTINIKRAHYYTWDDADTDDTIDPGEVWLVVIDGSLKYYKFTDADGDDVVDVGELMPVTDLDLVPDAVKTDRTYTEERQNFANWYSFYRRRELTAAAGISRTIVSMHGVNVGLYSINGTIVQPVLPVRVDTEDETATLLNTLYSMVLPSKGTPLRRGLRAVGRYFHADDGNSGGIGNSPFGAAEEGGECQQAFAIVMTDGYWNGSSPDLGNADGDGNTIWDGDIYGDTYYNTLADVAMYYYERDLSNSLANIVPMNPQDKATHQHMVTYTVSFGLTGTLNPSDYDLLGGPYPTWPRLDGDATPEKIDDLWHAAVNGRGRYLSAANPEELVYALLSIIQNIEGRIGSSSSVSVNGDELYDTLGADVRMFQATYSSDTWTGDVKSYQVDLDTGEVLTSSPLWSAVTELETKHWDSGRIIATFDGVSGIPFRFGSLTDELKDLLDPTDDTNAENILNYLRGDATNEMQNGGNFRNRTGKLGDIVHSSPVHSNGTLYSGSNDGMLHAFDAQTGEELFAYIPKLVFANLPDLKDPLYPHTFYVDLSPAVGDVYILADSDGVDNDGDGAIDESEEKKLKNILVGGLGRGGKGYYALDITDPSSILTESNLAAKVLWEYPSVRKLTITDVDGEFHLLSDPIIITTANNHGFSTGDQVLIEEVEGTTEANGVWTITWLSNTTFKLEGSDYDHSYTGGGKATPSESSWDDMGYSYSRPAIVNSRAGYIVMFGNGYNSESGVSKLIILDVLTGELVKSINTEAGGCNGLSSPVPIDVDFDGKVDYVYAGDLNGNLWKFDLTDTNSDNWDVAYKGAPYTVDGTKYVGTTPQPLFQARSPEGMPQPITTKPDVMDWCTEFGYMVTFGTGKWMGEFDYESSITQTIYGIWDYGDDEDDSEYLGVFDRGSTPELRNQLDSVTLLQQTVEACDPLIATCDGDFWVVGDQNLRILTDNMASVVNPWETSSEFNGGANCGDGDGVEQCEPNGYGANPDPVHLIGWYFDLPLTAERVISDALLRQGKAIYVPYTPSQTPCGAGGDTVVMEMDACSGGRLKTPAFDTNDDQIIDQYDLINIGTAEDPIWVAPSGIQAEGRLQPPAILRDPGGETEKKYFSSSRGKIVTVDEKAVTLGITYWMEFE